MSSSNSKATTKYNKSPSLYGGDIDISNNNNNTNKKRKKQSASTNNRNNNVDIDSNNNIDIEITADPIIGTCTKIEKDYYRLTTDPQPNTVRTIPTLQSSLNLVKQKWLSESIDYTYACNQLKSIRQDLTVQHIRNEFTVLVYETHARIAIESGDWGEFAQCQSQLHLLYQELTKKNNKVSLPNKCEFHAYKILQYLFYQREVDLHLINFIDHQLNAQDKTNPIIKHALNVRQALIFNNYVKFFQLYSNCPVMSGYLLDAVAERMRLKALLVLTTAYKPTKINLSYITKILAFDNLDECLQYCVALNLVVNTGDNNTEEYCIDTKLSHPIIAAIQTNKQQQQKQQQPQIQSSPTSDSSDNTSELTMAERMAKAMGMKTPLTKQQINNKPTSASNQNTKKHKK